MAERSIEQLLHGYRRGHEQLASSVKLPTHDAELITRLSDLSGSLAGAPKFASYLTAYPLPSGTYFALARTWPDTDAARAGCVLTHTLLVPAPLWATLPEPKVLDCLFTRPSTHSPREYESAVAIPERFTPLSVELRNSDHRALRNFVSCYFGEGEAPIVWFGQEWPEEVLWRLLRGLWPKLRATFSACTFCLQPRTLDDRPFELMFAPAAVYPRFQKKLEHFIDSTADLAVDERKNKVEGWCTEWERQLFGPRASGMTSIDPDLWAELDEDPTAIRRLFLVQGITESGSPTPQVFVGAMDLVESLAKSGSSALASKRRVAERAVQAARETADPASGLESLRLIEDRLRRVSFSRVQSEIGPVLRDAVATLTRKFPETTAQYIILAPVEPELTESWLGGGLLQGFRSLAQDDPDQLLVLRNVPAVVRHFLTAEPKLGAAFIRAAAAQRSDRSTRADLLRWLEDVRDPELRIALRGSLVPELGSDDSDILAELLKSLQADEVGGLLDVLWLRTNQFETPGIRDLIIGQVARGYPGETRDWIHRLSRWTPIVAHIFAATYPPTKQGILDLLDGNEECDHEGKAEAVAAFLHGLGPGLFPYWLIEIAHERSSFLSTLLDDNASSSNVAEQTQRLLNQVPSLPIAHWPSLIQQVLASSQRPFFGTLRDLAMRSLVSGCVEGVISESVVRAFQEHQAIVHWFHGVERRDIRSLLVHGASFSIASWINAWRWTATTPNTFFARQPTLLPELIDVLSRPQGSEWPGQISEMWSQILRRARSQSRSQQTAVILCVQALKFSFNNVHLPLGPLVAEAFHDVYTVVTSSTFSSETAPLFGMFNWDKGKDLRRDLIDCFLRSQWPPRYLALAVADVSLLRKFFKRIVKKPGGERYARTVLADLERYPDQNAPALVRALREMLTNPNFYEDWV